MGGTPIVFALIRATPYELTYLLTSNAAPQVTTITNAQLLADALTASAAFPGAGGLPLAELLRTPVTNQAEARNLMIEGGPPPDAADVAYAQCKLTPRDTPVAFGVDANVAAGLPVIEVDAAAQVGATCYLRIKVNHTYDR